MIVGGVNWGRTWEGWRLPFVAQLNAGALPLILHLLFGKHKTTERASMGALGCAFKRLCTLSAHMLLSGWAYRLCVTYSTQPAAPLAKAIASAIIYKLCIPIIELYIKSKTAAAQTQPNKKSKKQRELRKGKLSRDFCRSGTREWASANNKQCINAWLAESGRDPPSGRVLPPWLFNYKILFVL